jgi:hypothetical protein
MDAKPSAPPPGPPPEPAAAVELRELVRRAQAGDPAALPRIRQVLDERPEVWQHAGDLAALAERAWIAVLAADNPVAVEAMKRTLAQMKAELTGDQPTALERLLVDQIVVSWLECKYVEATSAAPGHASLQQAGFRLRRLESAQKRHLAAIKTLTTLRTLLPAGLAPRQAPKLFEEPMSQPA